MKPRLVVFSPMPPSRNGIADYAGALITALGACYECLCVLPDEAPAGAAAPAGVEKISLSRYTTERTLYCGARHLFQLGNNTGHAYLLPWLERLGGVTTIHDASLANLLATIAPEGTTSTAFRAAVAGVFDPSASGVVDQLDGLGGSGLVLSDEVNGLYLPARASRAVVVHSRIAAIRVLAVAPGARVEMIPHLAAREPPPKANQAARDRAVRLLCLGFVARAKRIDLVLRAAKLLREGGIPVEVTVVGALDPLSYDLEADIAALDAGAYIQHLGYLDESELGPTILDCDLLVNLRDPTSGETSGVLTRAMALGKAAVVTDVGWYAELPNDAVIKVPLSAMSPEGLADRLVRPIQDHRFRKTVGRRAWEMMAEAAPDRIAARYTAVIERAYSDFAPPGRLVGRPGALCFPRPGAGDDREPLWRQAALLPLADRDWTLHVQGGDAMDRAAARALGWSLVEANEELHADACLALEPPASETSEPLDAWLNEAMSRLAPGGPLVVAGRWSAHRRGAIRDSLAMRGLVLARDVGVADLPARLGGSIVPDGWRGMCFAPTTDGLGWRAEPSG